MTKKRRVQETLGYYLTHYFQDYLPMIKGLSSNTINSYRDTFVLLLDYLSKEKRMNIDNLSIPEINETVISEFLAYLETERGNCAATRNQRLTAIRAFYRYLQRKVLAYFELCSSIITIPNKKVIVKTLSYFSVEEIELLVNLPDTSKKYGFRDYVILLLMYETAARGQEIVSLKKGQLFLGDYSNLILEGKGSKHRRVPISNELTSLLEKYLTVVPIQNSADTIFRNRQGLTLTTKGIEYVILKYVSLARKQYPEKFNEHYTTSCIRRSRAMHLLESGINIVYIRDFLGHSSVLSTEIYAKANSKIKEKQLRQYSNKLNVEEKYSVQEKAELLNFLKELN